MCLRILVRIAEHLQVTALQGRHMRLVVYATSLCTSLCETIPTHGSTSTHGDSHGNTPRLGAARLEVHVPKHGSSLTLWLLAGSGWAKLTHTRWHVEAVGPGREALGGASGGVGLRESCYDHAYVVTTRVAAEPFPVGTTWLSILGYARRHGMPSRSSGVCLTR